MMKFEKAFALILIATTAFLASGCGLDDQEGATIPGGAPTLNAAPASSTPIEGNPQLPAVTNDRQTNQRTLANLVSTPISGRPTLDAQTLVARPSASISLMLRSRTCAETQTRCKASENLADFGANEAKKHCKIAYHVPHSNDVYTAEYYTNCGTCTQAVVDLKDEREGPLHMVSQTYCIGRPYFGKLSEDDHSFEITTLADSSCQQAQQQVAFDNCR